MFYEGKNLDNARVTKFIKIGTTPTSSSSSSTPEIECTYLEDEGIFEVDGHKYLRWILSAHVQILKRLKMSNVSNLLIKFESDLISFISTCFLATL